MQDAMEPVGMKFSSAWLWLACLVPFFLLAWFSHPAADDFFYAVQARDLGFIEAQKFWYMNWTGRYFATALQSGFPLAMDMLTAYPLVPLVMLGAFPVSLAILARTLNGYLREPFEGGALALGVLAFAALYVTQMPSLVEGFYWWTGVATYELPMTLAMLLAACLLSIRAGSSAWAIAARGAAAVVLALALAGSSETMLPPLNLFLLAGSVLALRQKHPSRWVWIAALAACVAGSLAVAVAPGNALRAAQFPDRPPPAKRLALWVWGTIRHTLRFSIRPMLLGMTILGVPVAAQIVRRAGWTRPVTGRHVRLAAASIFVVVAICCAPAYLSIGRGPPRRAMNLAYLPFLAAWLATLVTAVAWLCHRRGREPSLSARAKALGRIALVAGALVVGNLPRAVYDLVFLAPSFDRQVRARYAMLREKAEAGESAIALDRLTVRPRSLLVEDVGDDPSQLDPIARYFGLASLTVTEPDTRMGESEVR